MTQQSSRGLYISYLDFVPGEKTPTLDLFKQNVNDLSWFTDYIYAKNEYYQVCVSCWRDGGSEQLSIYVMVDEMMKFNGGYSFRLIDVRCSLRSLALVDAYIRVDVESFMCRATEKTNIVDFAGKFRDFLESWEEKVLRLGNI